MKTLEDYAIAAMPSLIAIYPTGSSDVVAKMSFKLAEAMQKESRRRKIEQQKEESK